MTKPTIPEVRERFAAYKAKHLAWGALHVVLSDQNVDDASVDFCIGAARDQGDAEGEALALLLREMSKTQRAKLGRVVR